MWCAMQDRSAAWGSGSSIPITTTAVQFEHTMDGGRQEVDGCDECNRSDPKPWPIFTVNYHGVEVCAKCLQPIDAPKRKS